MTKHRMVERSGSPGVTRSVGRRFRALVALVAIAGLAATLVTTVAATPASAAPTLVASDLTGGPPVNLVSFTDDPSIPFTSAGDGFNVFQRGVSATIPFDLLDDSLTIFPPDTQGVIGEADVAPFFGIVDTDNTDSGGSPVVATWVFDVSGATDLGISIDVGAMGDFEANLDTVDFGYSIDGGPVIPLWSVTIDESTTRTYTMDGGAGVTLNDPANIGATELGKVLQTITAPVTGTGSELTFTVTADTNGGGEAIVFRNIVITSEEVPEPTVELIHDIQGSGGSVAISGPVVVQGIVTALLERDDVLDGFFVQEEDADADADPATSEGIFVFCRANCPAVAAGDLVTVTGNATDAFGMSQIDIAFGSGSTLIDSSGNPLPTPVPVDLPAAASTRAELTFEALEGMLVHFVDPLVVSEYFQLARFGQVVLTADGRPFQFTDENPPSVAGFTAFNADLETRRIILDDDSNDNNDPISDGPDEPYYYPEGGLSLGNRFRGGDAITDLTGVMHWSFAGSSGTDAWRVRPLPDVFDYTFSPDNPAPTAPAPVGGTLRVASFNVLNYFTTLDTGPSICGPGATQGCRGANSAAELARQRDKIVTAMAQLDADVLGIIEIENDGDDSSIADLVAGLDVATGGAHGYIATGFIGTDAIKVGFIYDTTTVAPLGDFAILDSSVDPTFIDSKNRPVLVQTFVENATGERFTVAVNHLKSKGSPCNDVGDPGLGDGQANCAATRTSAALALANFLATDPTDSGDPDHLIIGDLNAYAMEDPITALTGAGYTDLLATFVGADAYTFVFDGQLGYLDHALANVPMLAQVLGATEWHINADEVNVFDYNDEFRDPGESSFERESAALPIYAPDALRSSDHDPVLVGLQLDSIPDNPTCNGLAATIIGTPDDDVIVGTEGDDVIVAFGGNDLIEGGNGQDVICAGYGDDIVNGGNGKDTVFGEHGDDVLMGDNGKDSLDGGPGADDADGGNGTDTCTDVEVAVNCEL